MANTDKPLLDALLETDWSSRFESFSAEETATLKLFNDLMWDTTGWAFFRQPARFHLHMSPERYDERLEHAGAAELRAAADDFRQVWMNGEPGCYHAVNAVLGRRLRRPRRSSEAFLSGAGATLKAASREILMWTGVPRGQIAIEGVVGTPIRAHQVVDDWMHGIKAHRDPSKREHVLAWSPIAYEWTLVKAMNGYLNAMLPLHVMVRGALGVLHEDRRAAAA